MRLPTRLALAAVCSLAALAAAQSAQAAPAGPGQLNFVRNATSSFDGYLTGASPAQKQWIRNTYWRMRGYEPFYDNNGATSWGAPSQVYQDIYALYRDLPEYQTVIQQHPEWILKDASGNRLYIPADCNGSSCTQYAADIGNQGFRNWWIQQVQGIVARGYTGVFVDDVNMDMKVANGAGQDVVPVDPRTGGAMSLSSWRRYMAEFTEQIRASLPGKEIVHNSHWWAEHTDPYVQRQTAAADVIELERGYNDGGLTAGGGKFGYETFMAHIDWLHSMGKSVILEPYGLDAAKQEYEIASYYLTRSGNDAIASDYRADPDNFSDDWQTNLGAPLGGRYEWKGLWRRDFANGIVLVNQPEQPARTVDLEPYRRLGDNEVTEVTLKEARGAVLVGNPRRNDTKTTLKARASGRVTLKGQVKGAASGNVKVTILNRSGKALRTRVARLSKGRYKVAAGRLRGGSYRAEAVYTGTWETKASSANRRFRVGG